MANVYAKDNLIRVSVSFTQNNTYSDPTTIKCFYKDPNNVLTTLTYGTDAAVVKDTIGKYHVDVYAPTAGNWWYRFEGGGNLIAASEAEFIVSLSQIL